MFHKGRAESVQHPPVQNLADFRSRSLQPGMKKKAEVPTKGKVVVHDNGLDEGKSTRPPSSASSSGISTAPPSRRTNTLVPRSPSAPSHAKRFPERPYDTLPARRDSSIGATSTNPKLRTNSVLEVAAAHRKSPQRQRETVNLSAPESKAALKVLKRLFRPIVIRRILRRRRIKKFKVYPPRNYTSGSVLGALRSERSQLSEWPIGLLELLVKEVTFVYYHPKEIMVYAGESHFSSGLVVLLHGQTTEERSSKDGSVTPNRPIRAQKSRLRHSPDVLCVQSILCEDRNPTCIRASDGVDIAIISSRWFWSVVKSFVLESNEAKEVLELFNRTVLPNRTEMMLSSYYATSVLLQRSWMWPFLSGSDRVKLARSMEVKVINMGDVLFEEGVDCPYIYFLRRGTLTVVVKGEPLSVIEPGSAFGELSAIFNEQRNSSVVSGSICELYALHENEIHHRFRKYPDLAKLLTFKALERRRKWMEDGVKRDIFSLVSILSGVPCLSHTTESMREELSALATIKTVPPGFRLASANTPCKELYVIGRGFVRVDGRVDLTRSHACIPYQGEPRSAGDYFGELFLRPHLWPHDIVTETSVDVWVLSKDAVLGVLESNKVQIQAIDVCRQGVALYRAQHGEDSITEGYSPLNSQAVSPKARRGSGFHPVGSASFSNTARRQSLSSKSLPSPTAVDNDAFLESFDWVAFIKNKNTELERVGGEIFRSEQRELREVDKETEKILKRKVQSLISVPPALGSNPADCDFPGEVNELQATIVEQLFLTPTEEQPRFLRQVNDSNVRLIVEDDDEMGEPVQEVVEESLAAGDVSVVNVNGIEEIASENSETGDDEVSNNIEASISIPFKNFPIYDMSVSESSAAWPPNALTLGSTPRRSLAADSGDFPFTSSHRASISRSHLVRPPSGLPAGLLSPRQTQIGSDIRSSPRNSIMRPISASEQAVAALRVRPASVDYSQQNKISAERSTSALDRFVKIEDKNYFNSYVKVLPLEQGELWIPEEDEEGAGKENDQYILLLMHVRLCDGDVKRHLDSKKKYTVLVKKGEHLVLRTGEGSIQEGGEHTGRLYWPIEKASFIKFIRYGSELRLEVADAAKEKEPLYSGTISTKLLEETGKIGVYRLPLSAQATPDEKLDNFFLEVVCLPVMNSDLGTLQRKLKANQRLSLSELSLPSETRSMLHPSSVELHIVAVKGLKHRVDASMLVYFIPEDGEETVILKTPHVAPKTRYPFWPADGAYLRVNQSGKLRFELQHKEHSIGTYLTSVDELVFGGAGVHRCPLSAPQLEEPLGTLLLNTLGTSVYQKQEHRKTDKAVFFHVKNVQVTDPTSFIIPPDLFVVIRQSDGKMVLRTPLVYSAYSASYEMVEGSCVLQCPSLQGSSFFYLMELCDNDIDSVVASTTLEVKGDGLGPEKEYRVSLGDVAEVVIYTQCYTVAELNRFKEGPAWDMHFKRNDPLTLLQVKQCDLTVLSHYMDTSAMDVLAVFASKGEALFHTTPQRCGAWDFSESSAVFRVSPEEVKEDEGIAVQLFSGTVEEADLLGQVYLPVVDLCRTGEYRYDIFTANRTGERDELRGSVTINILCGTYNTPLLPPGMTAVEASGDSEVLLTAGRFSFYSTALLFPQRDYNVQTPTTAVRLTVSSACNIMSNVKKKAVRVNLFSGGTSILSVEKDSVEGPSTYWDVDVATALVAVQHFPLPLRVEVLAKSLDEDSPPGAGDSAPDVLSMTQRRSSKKGGYTLLGNLSVEVGRLTDGEGLMYVVPVERELEPFSLSGTEREAHFLPPFSSSKKAVISLFVKAVDRAKGII